MDEGSAARRGLHEAEAESAAACRLDLARRMGILMLKFCIASLSLCVLLLTAHRRGP
jgi:hypothetical protein